MSLPRDLLEAVCVRPLAECWELVVAKAWELCSAPLQRDEVIEQLAARERALQSLDLMLANVAWDLWEDVESGLKSNAQAVVDWWERHPPGRAVLILDGLSLREVPWLLHQAPGRGYRVSNPCAYRAELPPDTTYFARALELSGRAVLENNQAGQHRLRPAHTETSDLPFQDCLGWVGAQTDWFLWHHWPDHRLHELDKAGKGLNAIALEAAEKLCSDSFWELVGRLSQGRRLLITSDHGYAAAGFFPNADEDQSAHLKALFKSGRHSQHDFSPGHFLPPTDLTFSSTWGRHRYALGQRRWKSQGGYPTLTHGGLTLLEVLCPFLELERM